MPVSKKQLRANRQNAQKSTGPKSVEGKAIASRNGIKYGLYSKDIIITSVNLKENKEEYDRLLTSLLGELLPQTGMQLYLVHKIANALWRSRRAVRAETAIVTRQLDHIDRDLELRNKYLGIVREIDDNDDDDDDEYEMTPEEEEQFRAIEVGRQSIPNDRFAVNILRYEMRLDRQLTRAYKLLCQLQDRQDRNQTESDGPIEIPVPVYRCPAVYGDECVQHRPAPDTHPPNTVSHDSGAHPPRRAVGSGDESCAPLRPRRTVGSGDESGAPLRPWRTVGSDGQDSGYPTPPDADGRENLAHRAPHAHPQPSPVNTPEEGFERPPVDMPTEDPVSEEDDDHTTSDTVESRPRREFRKSRRHCEASAAGRQRGNLKDSLLC